MNTYFVDGSKLTEKKGRAPLHPIIGDERWLANDNA